MTGDFPVRENAVEAALEKCARALSPAGRGRWEFALTNGKPVPFEARLEADWLLLDAPSDVTLTSEKLWNFLQLNGTLDGLAKLALARGEGTYQYQRGSAAQPSSETALHLRAEIPVPEDVEPSVLAARLHETVAGLQAALEGVHDGKPAPRAPRIVSPDRPPPATSALLSRCAEAGWPGTERSPGKIAVGLEVDRGFYQALVVEDADGPVHASVELVRSESLSERSRHALGALLLTTCGLVRLARAAASCTGDEVTVFLEVNLPASPSAPELADALSGLSVACRLCGEESKVMENEIVASEYLAIRGWSA